LQHRPPGHQGEVMGSLDQCIAAAVQRQHAPVDTCETVAGLDVEMLKSCSRRNICGCPSEFTRLKRPQQIPRISHLTILLARKPLLNQPLPSRPYGHLDLSTHSA